MARKGVYTVMMSKSDSGASVVCVMRLLAPSVRNPSVKVGQRTREGEGEMSKDKVAKV